MMRVRSMWIAAVVIYAAQSSFLVPIVAQSSAEEQGGQKPAFDPAAIVNLLDTAPPPVEDDEVFEDRPPKPSEQLTDAEISALKSHIQQCWLIPPEEAYVPVSVKMYVRRDGTIARLEPVKREEHSGFRLSNHHAESALKKCQPYSFLPQAKYPGWRNMVLHFDFAPFAPQGSNAR